MRMNAILSALDRSSSTRVGTLSTVGVFELHLDSKAGGSGYNELPGIILYLRQMLGSITVEESFQLHYVRAFLSAG